VKGSAAAAICRLEKRGNENKGKKEEEEGEKTGGDMYKVPII